jgi:GntR family transcriptional regulator
MTTNPDGSSSARLHGSFLDRHSKVPIYHQLYELLRDKILNGEWKSGDLIPAESELISHYGVSRITVRQAVDKMVNEHLVYRERGRGTFVSYPKYKTDVMRMIGFEEDMQQRGMTPSTRVLVAKIVPVSRLTAERLKINLGDDLAFIRRLRIADGEPISLDDVCLAYQYCPGILDGHDYASESLYEVLEKQYNIRIERAEQSLSAMVASKELSHLLEMPANQALMFAERVSYSQINMPVEFRRIYYRADRYMFQHELRR